ncbi:isochorismatase family protein [Frankia sp. AgPm24]|uniref:isochorismatase family protein n=1 Tax=Frankia sp. AgPm24 TaxID=631128 RepID=UPI00200EC59C|nr:isochorismatase family protein [Frankia sp. AgPm24]MCK9921035.1 isochorismatase family protein [Frankia sp. AgPm24]
MAITPIESYPMPAPGELPEPVVSWQLDPARAVLLVHDMQHYFLAPFAAGEQPRTDLMAHTRALRERCAHLRVPVIYTAQPGGMSRRDRGLLVDFWGPGMSADPADRGIPAELAPSPGDTVLTKWRASAFHRSPLLELMRNAGRDQMVICGVYAHVGVLLTAAEAFANDIRVFVAADAVADFSPEFHRMALDYAATRCAAVVPTSMLLRSLDAQPVTDDIRLGEVVPAPARRGW